MDTMFIKKNAKSSRLAELRAMLAASGHGHERLEKSSSPIQFVEEDTP